MHVMHPQLDKYTNLSSSGSGSNESYFSKRVPQSTLVRAKHCYVLLSFLVPPLTRALLFTKNFGKSKFVLAVSNDVFRKPVLMKKDCLAKTDSSQ